MRFLKFPLVLLWFSTSTPSPSPAEEAPSVLPVSLRLEGAGGEGVGDFGPWAGFSDCGNFLVRTGRDGTLSMRNLAERESPKVLQPEGGGCVATPGRVVLATNGSRLIGLTPSNKVGLWDANTGRRRRELAWEREIVERIAVDGELLTILCRCPKDKTSAYERAVWRVRHWNLSAERESAPWDVPEDYPFVKEVASSARGNVLAMSVLFPRRNGYLDVWDTAKCRRSNRLAENRAVSHVTVGEDGSTVAASDDYAPCRYVFDESGSRVEPGSTLLIWASRTGEQLGAYPHLGWTTEAVGLSPDNRLAAVGGADGTIRVYEIASRTEVGRATLYAGKAPAQRNSMCHLAFSPDGRSMASSMSDGTAVLWDLRPEAVPRDRPSAPAVLQLWTHLADRSGAKACGAIFELSDVAKETIPLIRSKLSPAAATTSSASLLRLIRELDSDRYDIRESAMRGLKAVGDEAEIYLGDALDFDSSQDLRDRVLRLLEPLRKAWREPEGLRTLRAIWVLERIGSAEARAVLEDLAGGAPGARLTHEAKSALRRLAARDAAAP